MGFWGSLVVCRSEADMGALSALADRDEGLEQHHRRLSGWQVGQYPGPHLADDAAAMLPEVAVESGNPVLLGFVLDSDAVAVEGFSTEGGHWRACLARESVREYWEDDDEEFEDVFLSPEAAALKGVQWAQAVGLTADFEQLVEVFRVESVDYAAELLFYDLLERLGV
jgi:hypothetical protein